VLHYLGLFAVSLTCFSHVLELQAAASDARSKKSKGDLDALLETALLYIEADKAIDVATASRRVSPLIANTLETKQQAVHKSEAIIVNCAARKCSLCLNC
jgi:hypothetical protein